MMVSADKNSVCLKNGQRSRGPSPNGSTGPAAPATQPPSPSSVDDDGEKIRVGRDYQAVCPEMVSTPYKKPVLGPLGQPDNQDRALLVWSPSGQISDDELDSYMKKAKEDFGYNGEQALGMLFWHKHDLKRATEDLANFTPFPDEWTAEDKVLFEQAITYYGKAFHRIKTNLPDKNIASLVKYYYTWKKTRVKTSQMDKQAAKKNASRKEEASEQASEQGSNPSHSDSDPDEPKPPREKDSGSGEEKKCHNCGIPTAITKPTHKQGSVCNTCYSHWRRTGNMRPTIGPFRGRDKYCYNWLKDKWRPPRGMHIDHEDLVALSAPDASGDALFTALDREVASFKRQVQSNKQLVSSLKRKSSESVDELRTSEATKSNSRWTNEELLLAVQGVRKYGKNLKAIADVVGTKSEQHVRTFFATHRKRFNLDAIVAEYEQEHGVVPDAAAPAAATTPGNSSNASDEPPKQTDLDVDVISEVDGGTSRASN